MRRTVLDSTYRDPRVVRALCRAREDARDAAPIVGSRLAAAILPPSKR